MQNNDEFSKITDNTNNMSGSESMNGSEYRYSGSSIPFNSSSQSDAAYENVQNHYYNNTGAYGQHSNNAGFQANTAGSYNKKPKKKGILKKAAALAASAVLFGAAAGGTMYGVYYAAREIFPINSSSNSNNSAADISTVTSNISTALQDIEEYGVSSVMDTKGVAKAALPAMVALEGTTTVSSSSYFGYGQSYEAQTSGTGIIVGKNDTELLILTNAHVVEDVSDLKCVFTDGESVRCTVKGSKADKDIAVVSVLLSDIKSDTLSQIAIAELGNSDDVSIGEQVVAIGNALGEGQSVTNGIISATNRSITVNGYTFEGLFMTNAAINSGNSGGALLTADGKVIGINFAKTSETGVEGMAYAIPVSNVRELIDSLMNRQTRTKVSDQDASYLGVYGIDITSSIAEVYGYPQGLMIRVIDSGSAAQQAGLEAYDIITSFDEQTISSMSGLQNVLQYYAAGETVTIEYYHREGSQYVKKSVEVTLGKKNI